MKTLKKRLDDGIKNVYYLSGEDNVLYDKAYNMILKACDITMPDFNLLLFNDENFSSKAVLDACESLPIGDNYKVVVIKDIQKVNESSQKELLSYISHPNESTCLIIMDFYSVFPLLAGISEKVSVKRLDAQALLPLISREVGRYGKQISKEAAEELMLACNYYLGNIFVEINKLAFYDSSELITKKMVEESVVKELEFTVFEFTEALGRKNASKAIILLHAMETGSGVLSLITNHFRRLFYVSITNGTNAEIANALNVKEFAVIKSKEQAKNFSKLQLKKILELLEEADYMLKVGKMRENMLLYFVAFNILKI